MTDDIVEELLERFGPPDEDCGQGPNCVSCEDQKLVARATAEIERLRTALQEIYNIWDGTGYADLCEGACGNLMFGVAQSALEGTP